MSTPASNSSAVETKIVPSSLFPCQPNLTSSSLSPKATYIFSFKSIVIFIYSKFVLYNRIVIYLFDFEIYIEFNDCIAFLTSFNVDCFFILSKSSNQPKLFLLTPNSFTAFSAFL